MSKYPYNLHDSLIITKEMLCKSKVELPKGIVSIDRKILSFFIENNILSKEAADWIFDNRKNVGFYL